MLFSVFYTWLSTVQTIIYIWPSSALKIVHCGPWPKWVARLWLIRRMCCKVCYICFRVKSSSEVNVEAGFRLGNYGLTVFSSGLLKLWVATYKWVLLTLPRGLQKCYLQKHDSIATSDGLPTNKTSHYMIIILALTGHLIKIKAAISNQTVAASGLNIDCSLVYSANWKCFKLQL